MKRFKESLNTAVFTTRYVMKENSPIIYIAHYEDGSWQFSGAQEDLKDEDYMVVALEEIIKHDPTIEDVADLPEGGEAIRKDKDSPWRISTQN